MAYTSLALSPSLHVGMFAIDSLRQLTLRFLEKEELSNYHFQVARGSRTQSAACVYERDGSRYIRRTTTGGWRRCRWTSRRR